MYVSERERERSTVSERRESYGDQRLEVKKYDRTGAIRQ